jgi:tetratricopeptide (TPR) repeat protein
VVDLSDTPRGGAAPVPRRILVSTGQQTMAEITAATGSPSGGERPETPLWHLWQAPVLLAGVAALAVAWFLRLPSGPDLPRQLEEDLVVVRRQLAEPDGDVSIALARAQHALEIAEAIQQRRGEVHLLLGTTHLRLGEQSPPTLNDEHYRLARKHLEQAEQLGVPEEEQGRLFYRLGKIAFILKDDPEKVVQRLAAGIEQADDPAEGWGLLAQAYLNLNPPNLKEALQANERLRQSPQVEEQLLAPAKLQAGELLLRLQLPAEARKVLEKIGDAAPPEILLQARLMRARTYQDEGKWMEAAELWRAILDDRRTTPPEPGKILYNLGICYRGLGQVAEALRVWEECLRRGHGDEAPASALALADLRLSYADKGPERALDLLARGVDRVQKPEEWKNSLVDLAHAREVFEHTAQALRESSRWDLAVQMTTLYTRLAVPGRALALRADLCTEWAKTHLELAQAAGDLLVRQKEESQAHDLLRQAGTAHAEAAEQAQAAEQAAHLWQAADCYLQGEDHARAVPVLERFLQAFPRSEHQGEGWYQLAQSYRHLNHEEDARKAYLKCVEFPTAFAYRAQYHLALAAIKAGQTDDAEQILVRNLADMMKMDPDPEAQEKSLFTLGNILYQRGEFRRAVLHLEEALGRFPLNPEATRARLQLADSYRQLANQRRLNEHLANKASPKTLEHFQREHQRWLQKAADEFQELAAFLQTPEAHGHLSQEEQSLVLFFGAECLFNLGQYDRALRQYENLIAHYHGREPGIWGLSGTVQVFAALNDVEKVHERLDEIQKNLGWLPESKRGEWVEYLRKARAQEAKPSTDPGNP